MANQPSSGELSGTEPDKPEQFRRRLCWFRLVSVLVLVSVISVCLVYAGITDTIVVLIILGIVLGIVRIWIGSFDPGVVKNDFVMIYSPKSEDLSPELKKLEDFALAKGKFPFAAYLAVISAAQFNPETHQFEKPETLSAKELTRRFVHLLAHQYGGGSRWMLRDWHVARPEDIGEIVYDMIAAGIIKPGPEDERNDFSKLSEFSKILQEKT